MSDLRLTLFGSPQLTRDGVPLRLHSRKCMALLAYLAVTGISHSRDWLGTLLWPEFDTRRSRQALRSALPRLRRSLGGSWLAVDREMAALDGGERQAVDVLQFRELLDRWRSHRHPQDEICFDCLSLLSRAAGIYHADFMVGFGLRDSPEFDAWQLQQAQLLKRELITALERLAEGHSAQGDMERAIAYAHRWLVLDPLDEAAHRSLIRMYASSGQQAAALLQVDAVERVLREQLDASPSALTAGLCQRVREGWVERPQSRPVLSVIPVKMRCTHCGTECSEGVTDCPLCGASLVSPQSEESDGILERLRSLVSARFEEQLVLTESRSGRERRVVTMLFAEVVSYASMAESLDPEEMMEVMEGALNSLAASVHRYGGTPARMTANGIFALFGAPMAHEDDAERACRAALEIIGDAEAYALQLEQQRGLTGFSVRVAIHTGLVVVGEIDSDPGAEYIAAGDAVSVAYGVGGATQPGTALITEDTHTLVGSLFETEIRAPVQVRGRRELVPVHRLVAPKYLTGKGRGIPGLVSPLVGRETELAALQAALERLELGGGGIVTLVGEAGIGKSRLVAELRQRYLGGALRWVEGRCLSYRASMAYSLWLDVLRSLLGVSAEDQPLVVRDGLEHLVLGVCPDDAEGVFPYLGRLMSLPLGPEHEARLHGLPGDALKRNTFRAVVTIIERTVERGPLIIQCEDLHWADATSLELLEQLLALTNRTALLLVCVFRPHRTHGCWRIREAASRLYHHCHTDLTLEPLSTDASVTLVGNLLQMEVLPSGLAQGILTQAEGNPFYVEEIIRSLVDGQALVYDEAAGAWASTQEVSRIEIPGTLGGVLRARIDQLPPGAKRTLQTASVLGRVFAHRLLEAVLEVETITAEELGDHLLVLKQEEMIRELTRTPELEFVFKHQLTQEAAYNSTLKKRRRDLHRRAAEVLEQLFVDRAQEQLGLLAYHWERAGSRSRATQYLCEAGEHAALQFANEEALGYYGRALDLTPEEDLEGRFALLLSVEDVHNVRGTREPQMQSLVILDALAHALKNESKGSEVELRRARYAIVTNDYPVAIAAARRAVSLAQIAHDVSREATGHLHLGQALWDQGDYGGSRRAIEQGLVLARSAGSRRLEGDGLHRLAFVCWYQGDFEQAIACCEESLLICRQLGDRKGEGDSLYTLGSALRDLGRYDAARERLQECLRINREMGHRLDEGFTLILLSEVHTCMGAHKKARSGLELALSILRQTGSARGEALALAHLGGVLHDLGDDAGAGECCQQALCIGRNASDRFAQASALMSLGDSLMGQHQPDAAASAYQEALALRRQLREYHRAAVPLAGLAQVSLAQRDLESAKLRVEEILEYLDTGARVNGAALLLVYYTSYRFLRASGDPRAEGILAAAYCELQEQASSINDPAERNAFLENVAVSRAILEAYAER